MSSLESLESRIAPAAGLTVTHALGGALNFTTTDGDDTIFIRSDEPGWISFGTQTGDLIVDGVMVTSPATIRMPKGPVTVDLLGGADTLLLNPMTLPGSLTVNDPSGASEIRITGLAVKGALTINGSADNDLIAIDGLLRVGKDLNIELHGGTDDIIRNEARGLTFSVVGSAHIHGSATNTIVALGFDEQANFARNIGTPLVLRDLRVGRDLTVEASGSLVSVFLHGAQTRIGGKLSVRATGAAANLDLLDVADGPMSVVGGISIASTGSSDVAIEGQTVNIGGSIKLQSGAGDDTFAIFSNTTMSLPVTQLIFGDGKTDTSVRGHEAWTLTGSIGATAGTGEDKFTLSGPGKVTGNVTGDFGGGFANVTLNGDGNGRMTVGTLLRETALDGIGVGIFNATMLGRVEVIGKGGADALIFDSAKVVGAVSFTGSTGSDGFLVDNQTVGYLTPSVFLGPVNVDLGGDADGVILGLNSQSGHATFFGSVIFKGILGETYSVAPQPIIVFKKTAQVF